MVDELAQEDERIFFQADIGEGVLQEVGAASCFQSFLKPCPKAGQQLEDVELGRWLPAGGLGFEKGTDEPGVRVGGVGGNGRELLIERAGVEEFLELLVEMLKFRYEGGGIGGVGSGDAGEERLRSRQIFRPGAPMEFVLKGVLDLVLELPRDIVAMGDIADQGQRFRTRELAVRRRQPGEDASDN